MDKLNINEYDRFLPIGSVVLLKGAFKPLLIIGYLVKDNTETLKDYVGIPYPEGLVSEEAIRTFDHEDIAELIHFGLYGNIFMKYEKGLLGVKKNE